MVDAEGNPADEMEARAILSGGAGIELRNAAANYVAPIFWGLGSHNSESRLLHNGSAFFIRVGGPTLLITAAHVIRQLEVDRAAHGPAVKSQVMNIGFDPLPNVVDIDDTLDVATVLVLDELPARAGKWVYQREPDKWPPPPPMRGRGLFFAGYPGRFRTESDAATIEFGLYGGLLTATSVSDSQTVSQLDRDYVQSLPGLDPPPLNAWLGGMSGAPGWTLTQLGWRLAGVLYQYSQDYELFYFRSAHHIRADGSLVRTDTPNSSTA